MLDNTTLHSMLNVTYGSDPVIMRSGHVTDLSTQVMYYINAVLIPILGVIGLVGNTLNLAVLSWKYRRTEVDTLERRALIGLISLTVSDWWFCLVLLPSAAFSHSKTLFSKRCLEMYYRLYGNYFHNVFIKISTWLTVIIAGARYIGICHPLKARIMLGSVATKLAIAATFIIWMALLAPVLWSYKLQHMYLDNNTLLYIVDLGVFNTNQHLKVSMTYSWAILGFFLPITVLALFNICLIRALRASHRLRQSVVRNRAGSRDQSSRITVTLVALVIMFIILVSPSELLHFYIDVVPESYTTMEIFLTLGNVLQAVNFSFHFVLYCAVNVSFRRAIITIVCVIMAKLRCHKYDRGSNESRWFSRSSGASSKTAETHVW